MVWLPATAPYDGAATSISSVPKMELDRAERNVSSGERNDAGDLRGPLTTKLRWSVEVRVWNVNTDDLR